MANRPQQNEDVIPLANALNQMRNFIIPELSVINLRNSNNTLPYFQCDVAYLHMQIMFSAPNDVNHYLENYSNIHGLYATRMFVNFPLQDVVNHVNVTALECALTWNTDPDMVRVIYSWGADLDTPNITGYFTNARNLTPYRNYLANFNLRPNLNYNGNNYPPVRGLRNRNEFYAVFQEVEYLAGDQEPPIGWHMPERIIDDNNNNIHGNNNLNMINAQY